ncbi:hypothetical protein MS3_00006917 [Schistosoma haematobium]|uniref:Saposin B-type domain-containing protein n=1 Tax=Schistosoma haematobium TaxID=6185 RepID=A0A922ITN3_SCHHA|nr:hypothetical protein MS3_00006917 [Schistosoma haematobium]KAH9585764.1 hypothetical protein MS3_00006917 [Schistosoma haematobium]CAH8526871.1 unnamed protein product [Schistosoma haematobium]CAH8529848.1 unnamed protein product [Schistosoma haematobium]
MIMIPYLNNNHNNNNNIIIITILLQCIGLIFVKTETIHGSYEMIVRTKDPKSFNGKLCGVCLKFYNSAMSLFLDHTKLEHLQEKLINICEFIGPFRDQCVALVTFTMFKAINKSIAQIDPSVSCEGWYLCYRK